MNTRNDAIHTWLTEHGPATHNTIAVALGLRPSAITSSIQWMERKGTAVKVGSIPSMSGPATPIWGAEVEDAEPKPAAAGVVESALRTRIEIERAWHDVVNAGTRPVPADFETAEQ